MEKIYINDLTVEVMSKHIVQFCALSGLEPPIPSIEFYNLIKETFGRYPAETLTNALKSWMVGKIDVRNVKQVNIRFISEILRTYIENHRHELKLKPKQYLQIQAPEQPKMSKLAMAKDMYERLRSNRKTMFYTSIFAMAYDEMDIEVDNFQDELTYIINIEDAQLKNMITQLGKKKVKRDCLPQEVYVKAAKMLKLLKDGSC
jgi:hypothetical protein